MTSKLFSGACALAIGALLLAGCGQAESAKPETEHAEESGLHFTAAEIEAAGIKVAALNPTPLRQQITVTASIQANQDKLAKVAPRIEGRIVRVMASLGDPVRAGQQLALIDSVDVGEAHSAYAQALAEQALAVAGAERADKLYAEQIIAQKDQLRARADATKAAAVLRAAGERRRALGIDGSATGGSQFAVTAPFAGTVIEKKSVPGDLAHPEQPLFVVADLSTVWIVANLAEQDLARVAKGAAAQVTVAAYPAQTFEGKVGYISSMMDKQTRTVQARIEVPNPDGRLKLDMFATAAIAGEASGEALTLPADAVVLVQGQPTAFVRKGEGFEPRAVKLGEPAHGRVQIKAGIKAGEQVVTAGAYALKAAMLKSQIGDAH